MVKQHDWLTYFLYHVIIISSGRSDSSIGSGVSVTAQNVYVGNVGKGADMPAGKRRHTK